MNKKREGNIRRKQKRKMLKKEERMKIKYENGKVISNKIKEFLKEFIFQKRNKNKNLVYQKKEEYKERMRDNIHNISNNSKQKHLFIYLFD